MANRTYPLPMLAKPLTDKFSVRKFKGLIAQEKFDGHRMLVEKDQAGKVTAWSRTGVDNADKLNAKIRAELERFPCGIILDGELLTPDVRSRSSDVSLLENRPRNIYKVFDLLQHQGTDITNLSLHERVTKLCDIFPAGTSTVTFAETWPVKTDEEITALAENVWARSGEGLIIKDIFAKYQPGKRPNAFWKVKTCSSELVKITSFEPSEGEINDRGPCGVTICHDKHGVRITLKTLDDDTCRAIEKDPKVWIGRKLWIEYFDKTPDGNYLSARWDHGEGW